MSHELSRLLQTVRIPAEAREEFAWYARSEASGTWTIPACPAHGSTLEVHRFARMGRGLERPGIGTRIAERCELCRKPELMDEIERCTCESEPWRCPAHQNLGCGG